MLLSGIGLRPMGMYCTVTCSYISSSLTVMQDWLCLKPYSAVYVASYTLSERSELKLYQDSPVMIQNAESSVLNLIMMRILSELNRMFDSNATNVFYYYYYY